jgi:hypothetical protein
MIQIELDEEMLLCLVVGTVEDKLDILSEDIIESIDISIIKRIYQNRLDEAIKSSDESKIIILLQALAYNRYKSKYKDEIADFVLDKLFELICSDTDIVAI